MHARAGSIIDLHDGLNGSLVADRSVVVRALPAILDGLAARRLRPVRLDALLGVPGYRPCRASGAARRQEAASRKGSGTAWAMRFLKPQIPNLKSHPPSSTAFVESTSAGKQLADKKKSPIPN